VGQSPAGTVPGRHLDSREAEPGRECLELRLHRAGDRATEANVFVKGVHLEDRALSVRGGVDLPDQPVLVERGQREIPSVGRRAARSWALTAMRRASARVSRRGADTAGG